MKNELLSGLTDEQIAKIKACKNSEEILSLAKNEGIELSEEQLEAVSGGGCFSSNECPKCGSKDYEKRMVYEKVDTKTFYVCKKCGCTWKL